MIGGDTKQYPEKEVKWEDGPADRSVYNMAADKVMASWRTEGKLGKTPGKEYLLGVLAPQQARFLDHMAGNN